MSLYSCLCFLSPNNPWSSGPGLTEMFYPVSLYLIVCHLSSYWVTSCHSDDRQSRPSQPHNLGTDLFNLLHNVIYGGTEDHHPASAQTCTAPAWRDLVLTSQHLGLDLARHCWLFQPPFEDSLARRAIRCWLSFYNWVIIFLLLLFLDFLTTGLTPYFKLTRQCQSVSPFLLVSLSHSVKIPS